MADYYLKERDIHGTLYRVYAEIADGTQPQATLHLTATRNDSDSAVEQSLIDTDGQLVVDAGVLPELRRLLNDAFRGIGVGAKLEDVGIDLETVRDLYPMAYLDWTEEQDRELLIQWDAGNSVEAIAKSLGRQPGAITRRLRRLGLYPEPPASPSLRLVRSATSPTTPPPSGPPAPSPPPPTPTAPPTPPTPPAQSSGTATAPPPSEPESEFDVDVDTRPDRKSVV